MVSTQYQAAQPYDLTLATAYFHLCTAITVSLR